MGNNNGKYLWEDYKKGKFSIDDLMESSKKDMLQHAVATGDLKIDQFNPATIEKYSLVDAVKPQNIMTHVDTSNIGDFTIEQPSFMEKTKNFMGNLFSGGSQMATPSNIPMDRPTYTQPYPQPVSEPIQQVEPQQENPILSALGKFNSFVERSQPSYTPPVDSFVTKPPTQQLTQQVSKPLYDAKGKVNVQALVTPTPVPATDPIKSGQAYSMMGEGFEKTPSQTYENEASKGFLETTGRGLYEGTIDFSKALVNIPRLIYKGSALASDFLLPEDWYNIEDDKILKGMDKYVNYLEELSRDNREEVNIDELSYLNPKKLVYTGVSAVPTVVASMVAGMGLAGATERALPLASKLISKAPSFVRMLPFGMVSGSGSARDAENAGANYGQQVMYGTLVGMLETMTEAPIFESAIETMTGKHLIREGAKSFVGKYGSLGLKMVQTGLKESAQEMSMEPLSGMAEAMTYNKNKSLWGKGGIVDPSQMAEAGYGGFAMSTVMGAFGLPMRMTSHKMSQKIIDKKIQGKEVTNEEYEKLIKQFDHDINNLSKEDKEEMKDQSVTNYMTENFGTEIPAIQLKMGNMLEQLHSNPSLKEDDKFMQKLNISKEKLLSTLRDPSLDENMQQKSSDLIKLTDQLIAQQPELTMPQEVSQAPQEIEKEVNNTITPIEQEKPLNQEINKPQEEAKAPELDEKEIEYRKGKTLDYAIKTIKNNPEYMDHLVTADKQKSLIGIRDLLRNLLMDEAKNYTDSQNEIYDAKQFEHLEEMSNIVYDSITQEKVLPVEEANEPQEIIQEPTEEPPKELYHINGRDGVFEIVEESGDYLTLKSDKGGEMKIHRKAFEKNSTLVDDITNTTENVNGMITEGNTGIEQLQETSKKIDEKEIKSNDETGIMLKKGKIIEYNGEKYEIRNDVWEDDKEIKAWNLTSQKGNIGNVEYLDKKDVLKSLEIGEKENNHTQNTQQEAPQSSQNEENTSSDSVDGNKENKPLEQPQETSKETEVKETNNPYNISITRYSTNEKITDIEKIKTALDDIINNKSDDYTYSKRMAERTIEKFPELKMDKKKIENKKLTEETKLSNYQIGDEVTFKKGLSMSKNAPVQRYKIQDINTNKRTVVLENIYDETKDKTIEMNIGEFYKRLEGDKKSFDLYKFESKLEDDVYTYSIGEKVKVGDREIKITDQSSVKGRPYYSFVEDGIKKQISQSDLELFVKSKAMDQETIIGNFKEGDTIIIDNGATYDKAEVIFKGIGTIKIESTNNITHDISQYMLDEINPFIGKMDKKDLPIKRNKVLIHFESKIKNLNTLQKLIDLEKEVDSFAYNSIQTAEKEARIDDMNSLDQQANEIKGKIKDKIKSIEEAKTQEEAEEKQKIEELKTPKDIEKEISKEMVSARKDVEKLKELLNFAEEKIEYFKEKNENVEGLETLKGILERKVNRLSKDEVKKESVEDEKQSPSGKIADEIKGYLKDNKKFDSKTLFKIADKHFGGTQSEGKYTPKDAYDSMELAVNQYLLEQKDIDLTTRNTAEVKENTNKLMDLLKLLPTQTKRTEEQVEFQQFSTPPSIAYIASWVGNMNKNDVVLEPSAGIGGLAVFGKINGSKVVVNEYSKRRAEVLKEMGFDDLYIENAEQLDNILPTSIKPTVVIMNPPFSSTAGRMEGKNNTKNATMHIEQALNRLEPNGRLVAIVGQGMSDESPSFKKWWKKIKNEYNVRANIGISGKNYTKYGTSFNINMFVIDKNGKTENTITGKVNELEEAINLLEGVANERLHPSGENKQTTHKSNSKESSKESEGASRSNDDTSLSTDLMGTKESGSGGKGSREGNGSIKDGNERVSGESDVSGRTTKGDKFSSEEESSHEGVGNGEGVAEDQITDRGISVSDKSATDRDDGNRGSIEKSEVKTEQISKKEQKKKNKKKDLSDSVFTEYTPQKLRIKGAKSHPGPLAQSSAMGAVEPPNPTYTPNLPKEIISEGKLSIAQLESVVYAGQSHEKLLPDGNRRGFFIGDGTGVGKGREISGVIMDNMRSGRKKAVWVSINDSLLADARRDWSAIGGDGKEVLDFGKVKLGNTIPHKEGILYVTYGRLGQGLTSTRNGEVTTKAGKQARIDQIVEWLGKDFDGVIAFDEAHKMQNSVAQKGSRGMKKASITGLAGVELQKRLPNARIVYVSATGATEVSNLAYAERLGLWGTGTSFASKEDFINKITSGGLASMELVARDMKAMGVYLARSLSYDGVSYGTIEHKLSPEQTEIYDTMAKGWQVVLQNIHEALEETGGDKAGMHKGRVLGQFWGSHQRFFNQILTSMQMPSVVEAVKKDLEGGKAVVMQLVNTNEATQNRQIAKLQEQEGSLEDLDLTPKETLMQYLDKSFPVQQFEEYIDDDGNRRSRMVYDSKGNPVINRKAVEMKEELMEQLGSMRVPQGPLEIILDNFGVDNVAEATGRTRRIVNVVDNSTGRTKTKLEKRTKRHTDADIKAFMDDKKGILIFSKAGGTGKSYHADLKEKNQRKRVHYLIQPGWIASEAVQGFGRTHRTNQASSPHYILVTTNLKGQKRFISSIARRLDQLGALTKGQRQTGSQGLFSAKDNLESVIARDALQLFYRDLTRGKISGVEAKDLLTKLGLEKLLDEYGNLTSDPGELRNINQFLNRILSLESKDQNRVFDEFSNRLDAIVDHAIANGTLDMGLENFKADKIKVMDEKVIRTDEETGVETKYIELETGHKNKPVTFKDIKKDKELVAFFYNTKSKNIRAIVKGGTKTLSNGNVVDVYRLYGQTKGYDTLTKDQFEKSNWEEVTKDEAKKLWEEAIKKIPEYNTEKVHLISGSLLPIWDRLPDGHVRVMRVMTDEGDILLGRLIGEREIDYTLTKLGAERNKGEIDTNQTINKILDKGYTVHLVNGWKLTRKKVAGEYRIEIIGKDLFTHRQALKSEGVFTERIQYDTRYFIPTGEEGIKVFDNVTKYRHIAEVLAPEKNTEDKINEKLKGRSGEKVGIVSNPDMYKPNNNSFAFSDPETEERYKASHGVKRDRKAEFEEFMEEFKAKSTREFKYLPHTKMFSNAREWLKQLQKQKDVANEKTFKFMKSILLDMDPTLRDLFERKVIMDNEMENLESGLDLAFGFTEETLTKDHEAITKVIESNPILKSAIEERQEIWKFIRKEYLKSTKAIGLNTADRLQRENYYRQMVLAHVNIQNATKGGKKFSKPRNRGYLNERKGGFDYNTNYLEAEFEVMSQMYHDIEIAKTYKKIQDHYDKRKQFEKEAKQMNDQMVDFIIAEELQDPNAPTNDIGLPISETEETLKGYSKRIAIGMGKLKALAEADELDDLGYSDVIKELKEDKNTNLENSRFFKYLSELADSEEDGNLEARMIFKAISHRKKFVKNLLGDKYMTLEKVVEKSEDFVVWTPDDKNLFYKTQPITGQMAELMMESAGVDLMKIPDPQIREALKMLLSKMDTQKSELVMGGKLDVMVLPVELADTLDEFKTKGEDIGKIQRGSEYLLRAWKINALSNPRRIVKYNLRNITGDGEAMLVGNPGAFKKVPQAIKEIYGVMKKGEPMSKDMYDWFIRGGMESTLDVQELGDINNLKIFSHLFNKEASVLNIPKNGWIHYWRKAKITSQGREAILRYASYLDYLEQIENSPNNLPKNYGASIPDEIKGLIDPKDKAYKLANDLLGAYDSISVYGQNLRKYLIPFWSYQEVNFKRYVQLWKNAQYVEGGGKQRATMGAVMAGKFLIKATALGVMLSVWNNLLHGDEEDDLPEYVKKNPYHIIFGRKPNGEVIYFDRLGMLPDFVEWFGLDALPKDIKALLNGKKTAQEIVLDMAKSPLVKTISGLTPYFKLPAELLYGKSAFPDPSNPTTIRDKWLYLAQTIGVENEYRALTKKPSKSYGKTWEKALYYTTEKNQSAYYEMYDIKERFNKEHGKAPYNGSPSLDDKAMALYYMKRAIKLGDEKTFKKYMVEYVKSGGTKKGRQQSLKTLHPLYGINKGSVKDFKKSLDEEDKITYDKALEYYNEVILKNLEEYNEKDARHLKRLKD